MPGGLAERAVIASIHQSDPAGRVVADRGDLLLSPSCGRNPRSHANMIARSTAGPSGLPGRVGSGAAGGGQKGVVPEGRPSGLGAQAGL
jgi:hypothetical protein